MLLNKKQNKKKHITFRKKQHISHNHSSHNHSKTRRYKPSNCHPSLSLKKNRKKVLDHSCFTSDALVLLKNSFNYSNPHKTIETNDPKEIWNHLYTKIPECEQETCWLNYVPNKTLQKKLKSELFTPFQPSDWKKNKNAWVSNYDMDAVLKQYQETYYPVFISLGPTPIDFDSKKTDGQCVWDEICRLSLSTEYNKGVRKIGIIYNLDTSKGYGTHWVSMFIDLNSYSENGLEENPFIFYFNSSPEVMPKEIHDLIQRLHTQWIEFKGKPLVVYNNTKVNHQRSDTECGMYSLFFIITCLTRKTDLMPGKQLITSDLIDLFASKNRIDDKYIGKFREIYFNPVS
jgi:hypothetical protein